MRNNFSAKVFMQKLLAVAFFGFSIVFNSFSAPTSAEQLRSEFESALKAKDTNAIFSLYNWNGGLEGDKDMALKVGIPDLLKNDIASVKLSPLPTNFPIDVSEEQIDAHFNDPGNRDGDNGWRGRFNVKPIGMLDIYTPKEKIRQEFYGATNNSFYISQLISYLAPGKSLYIRVLNSPDSTTYTGSWVFVKGGKEITVNISDKTNEWKEGWGDYIKSCTVRRTSTNEAIWFHFQVTEDGTNIFESGEITNEEPVTYKRKQP
jgi:hypothetical protein